MTVIFTYLPFLLSFVLGFLSIELLNKKQTPIPTLLAVSLAGGLGLGLSSFIMFLSYLIFNQLIAPFVIGVHLMIIGGLITANIRLSNTLQKPFYRFHQVDWKDLICLAAIIGALVPLWIQAQYYPHGGWDAWSTWNLKSKFLLLGGTHWQNMFDPTLWRSSPHYPLLLPLINTWAWCFHQTPLPSGPTLTAVHFTFFLTLALYSGLKKLTKSSWPIFIALSPLALPFIVTLIIGQYADLTVGYYLFVAVMCVLLSKEIVNPVYLIFAGIFLGMASFTKGEGLIAAGLITGLTILYLLIDRNQSSPNKNIIHFLGALCLGSVVTIIFTLVYAPENITFINGLTSQTNPSTVERFKIIMGFYWFNFTAEKWHGLWIPLALMLLLSKGRCLHLKVLIIPAFLLAYNAIIIFYYYLNTYFEIIWWMQTTFTRLNFAMMPMVLFWAGYSFWLGTTNTSKTN